MAREAVEAEGFETSAVAAGEFDTEAGGPIGHFFAVGWIVYPLQSTVAVLDIVVESKGISKPSQLQYS
jgi:hypothetical protein